MLNVIKIKPHPLICDISQKITGNLQRQLVNLQVLDYITGQIDRHTNNYFIQEDESTGMLTGVTGIDNDFSILVMLSS